MRIGIVGSRSFWDYQGLCCFIFLYLKIEFITLVVSGGAEGADTLAEQFAEEFQIETDIIKPEWKKYGKAAGKIRNTDIVKKCDLVFIFWDGVSPGTKDTIAKCKKYGVFYHIYYFGDKAPKSPVKGFNL